MWFKDKRLRFSREPHARIEAGASVNDALDSDIQQVDGRSSVAETLLGSVDSSAPISSEFSVPVRGDTLGRYVVLSTLGAGAMGVVLAAYDPELDRKVAIKLVKNRSASQRASELSRLQREAQAMAKLSHPNVVAVHDVGVVEPGRRGEGQLFIAMEYIEGQTLSKWLATPRHWREVLDLFLLAGSGLVAAHAAGVVHRDFKPENVLLGDDGRVRVLDFGLALAGEGGSEREATSLEAVRKLPTDLTATGTLMGTPAYMAPEQFLGFRADARADQFSFCVALYEGLYGKRPFAGDHIHTLLVAVTEGRIEPPPRSSNVPAWLRSVVMRGLSREPESRFASMQDLLGEIDRHRNRASSWRFLALGGVLAVTAAGLALMPREQPQGPCATTSEAFATAWDASKRAEVEKVFAGAGIAAEPVIAAIDRYAEEWTALRRTNCEATRVASSQSDELMDLRNACLDRRRNEIGALIDVLRSGRPAALAEANKHIESLVPVAECSADDRLRQRVPLPSDATVRAAIIEAELTLANASAQLDAGMYAEALAQVESIPKSTLDAYAPLRASHEMVRARTLLARGEYLAADVALNAALVAAADGGDDRLLAEAMLVQIEAVGVALGHVDEGQRIAQMAKAQLARLDNPVDLRRRLRVQLGNLERVGGKPEAALAIFSALATELEEDGAGQSNLALSVNRRVAGLLANLGRYEEADKLLLKAIEELESRLGPEHPDLIIPLSNLGASQAQRGDFDAATATHKRLLALAELRLGEDHPDTAVAYESMGVLAHHAKRFEQARDHLARAEASYAKIYDAAHPSLVRVRGNLAAALIELKDYDTAESTLLASAAALKSRYGDEHDYVVFINNNLAEVYLAKGRLDEALAAAKEAHRIANTRFGPASERTGESFTIEGRVLAAEAKLEEALASFDEADKILANADASTTLVLDVKLARARALAQTLGRQRDAGATYMAALEFAKTTNEDAFVESVYASASAEGIVLPR